MNIVDSSGWLEYLVNSKNAKNFQNPIEKTKKLIVPTIILYEVFKKVLKEKNKDLALIVIAHMKQGTVVDFDFNLSILAANLSQKHDLPMADSIILATARQYNAIIWTQDSDFRNIKNVKYFPKK
jgi:predicted nucleic acid-binding protein